MFQLDLDYTKEVFEENFELINDFENKKDVLPMVICKVSEVLDELRNVLANEY